MLYMTMFAMNFGLQRRFWVRHSSWFMQVWTGVTAAFPAAAGRGSGEELHVWYSKQVRKQ